MTILYIFFLIIFINYIISLVIIQFSTQLIIYHYLKYFILLFFFSIYGLSLQQYIKLDNLILGFQYLIYKRQLVGLQIHWLFGIDQISIYFLVLTTFIFILCSILAIKEHSPISLLLILIGLEICLLLTFSALDLFLFSCFFESLLILIFFLILFQGSRIRRVKALTYFVIYTILGSGFLFLALLVIYFELQTFTFFILALPLNLLYSYFLQQICLFFVFAIKLPIMPLHLQLPEAHVEAPTIGSIILASLLLKVGGYGFIRFLIFIKIGIIYYKYILILLALYSILISSVEALRQSDIKKIIAYSSIAHINVGLLGICSITTLGLVGHLILIISHGFISAGLFLLIGILYERTHSRILFYHKGIIIIIPIQSIYLICFILSNIGFPGTSGFLVELLIFIGLGLNLSINILIFLGIGLFLCFIYCVYIITGLIFGILFTNFKTFIELKRIDNIILILLLSSNILLGLIAPMFIKPITILF